MAIYTRKVTPSIMTIVYTKLVCDLFHPGHIQFLKQAKSLGDKLVVHVVSDERVAKAKRRPIMTQEERAIMVQACIYVDEVQLEGPQYLSHQFMTTNGYDLYVFACANAQEELTKKKECGDLPPHMYKQLPYTPSISTSLLLERITHRLYKETC